MSFRYLLLLLCFSATGVSAARMIELDDGSRIRGEVVAVEDGIWVIETRSMGVLSIPAARIRGLSDEPSGAGINALSESDVSPSGGDAPDAINAIRSTIASDVGLMRRILSLRDDPAMQAVLADPEIMAAVQRLDFATLRNHPKFQALLNDPDVRSLASKLR